MRKLGQLKQLQLKKIRCHIEQTISLLECQERICLEEKLHIK